MRARLLFVGLGLSVVACSGPTVPPASPEVPATTPAASPPQPDPAPSASAASPPSAANAEPNAPADVRVATLLVPLSESREILDNLPAERVIRATTPELRACLDHVGGPGKVWITGRIDPTGALVATNIVHADVPDASARCVLGALQKVSMGASSPPIAVSVVVSLREPAGSKPTSTEFSASSLPSSDDAQEFGMLGLVGTGEGGGGRGEGIGLGSLGPIGHGAGTGLGRGDSGRLGGSHGKPPSLRMGATNVHGRLPPEVIQRIVRQNFGRLRTCYEKGLLKDPNLAGRVAIRFVIETDGSVSSSSREASTDLSDDSVVACTAKAFGALSFPAPEGGKVVVVYPISFSPGDDAKPAKAVAKPSPQKKSIKVAGQPIEKLVAADLVRALREGDTPNSSVVALDEKAGSPYVVFTESGGEILSIQRVLALKKGEVPSAAHYEISVFERSDEPAKRYAVRVLGRDAQLAGELTERIVE